MGETKEDTETNEMLPERFRHSMAGKKTCHVGDETGRYNGFEIRVVGRPWDDEDTVWARLMLASPKMLTALKEAKRALNISVQHLMGTGSIPDPEETAVIVDMIDEAIKKAESGE